MSGSFIRPAALSVAVSILILGAHPAPAGDPLDKDRTVPDSQPTNYDTRGAVATESSAEDPQWLNITISFANEPPVKIQVLEGGLATYRSYVYGESFGVIPQVHDPSGGDLEIHFVSLSGKRPHYRAGRVLGHAYGKLGAEVIRSSAKVAQPVAVMVELADRELVKAKIPPFLSPSPSISSLQRSCRTQIPQHNRSILLYYTIRSTRSPPMAG